MRVYYDRDADINLIKNKNIVIVGLWKSRSCTCNEFKRLRY